MLLSTLFLFIEQPKTLIFIAIILILFFGAKRIPEMMRGIGQGVREFKDAASDINKAPQTSQQYNPNQPSQQPYGQQSYDQQPYPAAGQPGYPQQYPNQPPYAAQPTYPAQQAPVYGQPTQAQVPPATHDANGQPLA